MYDPKAITYARRLRHDATPPEQIVWSILRGRRLGKLKFRRQEPIGPFIVDFCCREIRLVVEVDGESHADKAHADQRREEWLMREGYRIVRLTNADVNDLDAVARLIAREAGIEWNA